MPKHQEQKTPVAGRISAAPGGAVSPTLPQLTLFRARRPGKFFGWKARSVTKSATDFTKEGLLAKGWTKERLIDVAEGYEAVTRITPQNPSAAARVAQVREIAKLFD